MQQMLGSLGNVIRGSRTRTTSDGSTTTGTDRIPRPTGSTPAATTSSVKPLAPSTSNARPMLQSRATPVGPVSGAKPGTPLVPETPALMGPRRHANGKSEAEPHADDAGQPSFATPSCESPGRHSEPPTDNDIEDGYRSSPLPRSSKARSAANGDEDESAPNDDAAAESPRLPVIRDLVNEPDAAVAVPKLIDFLRDPANDLAAECAAVYMVLTTRLRSQPAPSATAGAPINETESPEIKAVLAHMHNIMKLFARDLAVHSPPEVAREALKLLGFFLYSPQIHSTMLLQDIVALLKPVFVLAKATTDKAVCHLCVWVLRMQRLSARVLSSPLLPHMIDVLVYAIKMPFQSTTIPTEAVQALDNLIRLVPRPVVALAKEWMLPMYASMTVRNELVRKHSIEFFTTHMPLLAEDLAAYDAFLGPYYERDNARLIYEITELTSRNERDGMKVWSIVIVLLAKYIQASPAFVNGMLKIVERRFNVKKASSKLYGYRAWSALIYSFATTGCLLQDRRLKLIMIPIMNSFMFDRHMQLRLEATHAWLNLVFAIALCAPAKDFHSYFSLIDGALVKILVDQAEPVRECGWKLLDALLHPDKTLEPTKLSMIVTAGSKPIEYVSAIPVDPKWIRLNAGYFLNIFKSVHEAEGLPFEYVRSELTGMPIIAQPVFKAFVAFLSALDLPMRKEHRLTPDSQNALIRLGEFLGDILHSTAEANKSRMDTLQVLLAPYLQTLPSRHLTSPQCRFVDLEETCTQRMTNSPLAPLFRQNVEITPLVHILLLWMECCDEEVPEDPVRSKAYWSHFAELVNVAAESVLVRTSMYSVVYMLEVWPTAPDLDRSLRYWSFVAHSAASHLVKDHASAEANPFDDGKDEHYIPILVWPLSKLLEAPSDPAQFPIDEWVSLWKAAARIQATKDVKNPYHLVHSVASWFVDLIRGLPEDALIHETKLVVFGRVLQVLVQGYHLPTADQGHVGSVTHEEMVQVLTTLLRECVQFLELVAQDAAVQGPLSEVVTLVLPAWSQFLAAASRSALPTLAQELIRQSEALLQQLFHDQVRLAACLTQDGAARFQAVMVHVWLAVLDTWLDARLDAADVLTTAAPFLTLALRHPVMAVVERAVTLWNRRFGAHPPTKLPPMLEQVLAHLAADPHVSIDVPEHLVPAEATPAPTSEDVGAAAALADASSAMDVDHNDVVASSDPAPAAAPKRNSRTYSDRHDDDNDDVPLLPPMPAPRSPSRYVPTPGGTSHLTASSSAHLSLENTPSRTGPAKKRMRRHESQTEYVPITSRLASAAARVKTERQLEREAEPRHDVPVMYNSLDSQRIGAAVPDLVDSDGAAATPPPPPRVELPDVPVRQALAPMPLPDLVALQAKLGAWMAAVNAAMADKVNAAIMPPPPPPAGPSS
ncbi:DNA-binding protein rif1 [Allomyces arbusculus]|nr:DNA-binding protein rif1 [Allomyces arbusculus]